MVSGGGRWVWSCVMTVCDPGAGALCSCAELCTLYTYLTCTRTLSETKMVFRCLTGRSPSYLSALFNPISHTHQHVTRASSTKGTSIPRIRTEHGRHSFAFRGAKIWNALPPSMRELSSYDAFSTAVRDRTLSYYM